MKNRKISKKKSLDSNGKKRKILLATLIPIGVVGITLGTALPLYFCFPGKKDLPEFSIINPLGDHFVLGYPTETQTLSVDPPISEGTIIAYNLWNQRPAILSTYLHVENNSITLDAGLGDDSYSYTINVIASRRGYNDRSYSVNYEFIVE